MSRRRWRLSLVLSVVLALVVAGVGVLATGRASGEVARSGAGAQTFKVDVDGHNPAANEAFIAYFPSVVRVHPGDTVVFKMVGNGEPHTVTLGTTTNTLLAAFEKLTPAQQNNPPKSIIALDAKVPNLFPNGPGDAVQSAANPCFVTSGAPPAKGRCPKVAQPDFTGQETFYNSGWLNSNQKFTVHLASGIAPGTYRFMCALHREGMTGKIVVVPQSAPVASPAAQFAAGQKTLNGIEAKLTRAVGLLRQGKPPIPVTLPGENVVLAGSGQPGAGGAITEFGPKVVHIQVGDSVTWWMIGPHSVTFDSTKTNDDIRRTAPDGTVHINPAALAPAGGPGEPAKAPTGGTQAHPKFVVVASSSWNGKGFHSSGVFGNSDPPTIEGYKLTFTKAGKYKYICTVHDNMKGEVDVG